MLWSYLKRMYMCIQISSPLLCQFWTACLVMFWSLLRISHIVPSDHTLPWFQEWGVVLSIRSVKCNYSEVHEIRIRSIKNPRYGVVYLLRKLYLSKQGDVVFPLLSYAGFHSLLKFTVMRAHITVRLTSHSVCRGGASFLSSVGMPLYQIKESGSWK